MCNIARHHLFILPNKIYFRFLLGAALDCRLIQATDVKIYRKNSCCDLNSGLCDWIGRFQIDQ